MPPETHASNPYTPSESAVMGNTSAYECGHGQVPAEAVKALRQARPWVLLIAILGSIITGMLLVSGLVWVADGSSRGAGGLSAIPVAVCYMFVALSSIYPMVKLFRYAGSIWRLVNSGSPSDLVEALRHQTCFWRFVAIIACLPLVLSLLIFVFAAGSAILRR